MNQDSSGERRRRLHGRHMTGIMTEPRYGIGFLCCDLLVVELMKRMLVMKLHQIPNMAKKVPGSKWPPSVPMFDREVIVLSFVSELI